MFDSEHFPVRVTESIVLGNALAAHAGARASRTNLSGSARDRMRHCDHSRNQSNPRAPAYCAARKLATVNRPVNASLGSSRPGLIAPLCSNRPR